MDDNFDWNLEENEQIVPNVEVSKEKEQELPIETEDLEVDQDSVAYEVKEIVGVNNKKGKRH